MTAFDKKVYEVYSKKHDVHGEIYDYDFVIKLKFTYNDKEQEIGMKRPFPDSSEEAFLKLGEETIDSYVEKLLSGEIKDRRLMLHYWYVSEYHDRDKEEITRIAHGIVTGHNRLIDSTEAHTSTIREIVINEETGEAEIHTRNSRYYCPLAYCRFWKQDKYPYALKNYNQLKEKYENVLKAPTIEPGNVLLVLSNFNEYYFNSLYYIPMGQTEPVDYSGYPHIGTFQDSYLVETDEEGVDIRYFPHFQNIEFYAQYTNGCPLFVENIGDVTLYVRAFCGTIELKPGERKEVMEENVEDEPPVLPGGDLYPAGVIE